MNLQGIFIGAAVFIIIGVLHPVVIKAEYYIGTKAWPIFLISGLMSISFSIVWVNSSLSILAAILGFSLFWSIQELFEQEKRVQKGWFPKNPKRTLEKAEIPTDE